MDSPAEQALRQANEADKSKPSTARFLSGITVVAPLISAIIQGDADDISDSTNEILIATKALIDAVNANNADSPISRNAIIDLCVHCAASSWARENCIEVDEWAEALNVILSNVSADSAVVVERSVSGYSAVFCALSEFGLLGDDCLNFHGVIDEIAASVNKSSNKWKALNSINDFELIQFAQTLQLACCNLFVSTLRYEHGQYLNECYRAAVDPHFKQAPFDMAVLLRRYKLYATHLFEAIYVNASRR